MGVKVNNNDESTSMFPLWVSVFMCVVSYLVTCSVIERLKGMFLKAGLYGVDLCKTSKEKIPEAIGVVSGCIFLITMFLFIPIPFGKSILIVENFPHHEFAELLAALLSICCMLLLGFADDVLDLRWRHKLLLPTIASLPLLVVYYVNINSTRIIVPMPLREMLGNSVDIGYLYYIYMGMLAVFCTNAINILAGVNGLEAGQSVVIALSIIVFNIIEMFGECYKAHKFSLYIILPYLGTTLGLLKHNWYPSKVFVGDTFCYLSGMTFAVVGILGHFSKTAILFFIPQIFNFLYSLPQLFHFVPCPRHRLPQYNPTIDKLDASKFKIVKNELNILGRLTVFVVKTLRIGSYEEKDDVIIMNNLTLINFVLIHTGPVHERNLTVILLCVQVLGSLLAFTIRYPLASYFYDS